MFGPKVVLVRKWKVADPVDLIVKKKIDVIGGVPALVTAILQAPQQPRTMCSPWCRMGAAAQAGGAGHSLPLADCGSSQWARSDGDKRHHHGADWPRLSRQSGRASVRQPHRGHEGRGQETDEEMAGRQPGGHVGVAMFPRSMMMRAFVDKPRATRKILSKAGWLGMGDMAHMDEKA